MEESVTQHQAKEQPPLQETKEKSYRKNWKKWILIYVIIGLLLYTIVYFFVFFKKSQHSYSSNTTQRQQTSPVTDTNTTNPDEPPLKIKSIGVNLDYYDPKTGKAGDFLFTKQKLQFDMLFMGYGFVIPANTTSTGQAKANPQPTFILPLGTKVRSLVDGVVANMPTLWSGDISIQVTTDGKLQRWIYEVEHVINPTVKVGDTVMAGQIIAEVSRFDKGAPEGFGAVEIGILEGGNPPQHVCPFTYLDQSIKEEMLAKIKALYVSWEDYRGNTTLYNEEPVPGCLTLTPIDG